MNNRSFHKGNKPAPKTQTPEPTTVVDEFAKKDVNIEERIAKRMARAGLCSRREAEVWILDGRVKVNGKLLDTPAFKVSDKDKIEVDGNLISQKERTRLWLFHKPSGTVTTNFDPDGRKTIFSLMPPELPRLMTVGRLDINTEGLLLMTNDGGLARVLELPATGWLRRYRVRVHGRVNQEALDTLKDGIAVDGVLYGAITAEIEREQGTNTWLNVSLREGKNREIKKVMGHLGLEVTRLIRVSFGPFQLSDLPPGTVREIRSRMLRDQLGEKLIEEASADFDAPIINQAPDVARTATKAAEQGDKKSRRQSQGRQQAKAKPGTVRDDTLSRLTTKSGKDRPDKKSGGRKSGPKPGGAKVAFSNSGGSSRSGKPKRSR